MRLKSIFCHLCLVVVLSFVTLCATATTPKVALVLGGGGAKGGAEVGALKVLERAGSSAKIYRTGDPKEAAKGADVLYTDTWISMGKESESAQRISLLKNYQINKELVSLANKDVMVLHCLPAYRGKEITEEIFEQFAGNIFDQAENRLHTQKAIMDWMTD